MTGQCPDGESWYPDISSINTCINVYMRKRALVLGTPMYTYMPVLFIVLTRSLI